MRTGRPKLPVKARKDVNIIVRVKIEEKQELEAAAESRGQKFSQWVREALINAARKK